MSSSLQHPKSVNCFVRYRPKLWHFCPYLFCWLCTTTFGSSVPWGTCSVHNEVRHRNIQDKIKKRLRRSLLIWIYVRRQMRLSSVIFINQIQRNGVNAKIYYAWFDLWKWIMIKKLPTRRDDIIRRYELCRFRERREIWSDIVDKYNWLHEDISGSLSETETEDENGNDIDTESDEYTNCLFHWTKCL